MLRRAPSWVLPGAKYDLDFANSRYWGGTVGAGRQPNATLAAPSLVVNSGNGSDSVHCAPDIDGKVVIFRSYTPRITRGMGLWAERRSTNYALRSRDFSQAVWVKTNVTATKNQAGADTDSTANAASSLTASASNGTCLQSITLASGVFVVSAYIKRLVGTGTIEMTMDGGTTWVDITSQISAAKYQKVSIPSQTVTNPQVGFRIATSGDSIAVDFFQGEDNDSPTSPMITTTATVKRYLDEPTFNTTGTAYNDGQRLIADIFFGGPVSMYAEYTGNGQASHLVTGGAATWRCEGGADGAAVTFGNTNTGTRATTSNTGNFGLGNMNKVAGVINGATASVCLNGGPIASNSSTFGYGSYSHIGIINDGSGEAAANGYIKRLAFWMRELTAGEMLELTR